MKRFSAGLAAFAFAFLILHLPYLPASLEDLDSINFALGVRQFDVAHHQPHPPGYPGFILAAKAVHLVVPSETVSLGLLSVVAGALGVLVIGALFRRLDGDGARPPWSLAGAAVAMTTPLYWFTAVRPLSDSSGLAAALAVQAMTLAATSTLALATAAFCAGVATGLRSQVAWLTLPLLIFQGLRTRGSGLQRRDASPAFRPQPIALLLLAFAAGALVWFFPLVILTGGPAAYWHALFDQGAEDLGNIQMLWTSHGPRDVADAMYYALVAPWAAWPIAAIALTCAAAGLVRLFRRQRPAAVLLAAAFGPYLVFDLLFQETFTSRYALPLVVPMAYLAVAGLRAIPWDIGLAFVVAIAMFDAHAGGTSIAAYARAKAPAFRLLDEMRAAESSTPPVLAMDRRQWFDLRRPIKWVGDSMPPIAQSLPAPPQHEWLEAVTYWNGGGRAPVWFLVDPMRASIDLVQHGDPVRYRWTLPYPVLLSGVRPSEMDWYRVDRPEWYVGEGWSLTPEAAGVADADRRGPSLAPIEGWIDRRVLSGTLLIGGRSLDAAAHPRLTVSVQGRLVWDGVLNPGPFLVSRGLPSDLADAANQRSYVPIRVQAAGPGVAVEQFDASATRALSGFGAGWHEPEFDPRTGRRWRWLSERGEVIYQPNFGMRAGGVVDSQPLTLHLEGESSRRYFSRASQLTIRSGDRRLLVTPVADDFSIDVPVEGPGPLVLETDQVFLPADRGWRRSADRRHLGLRIFKAEIRKAARPAS